MFIVLLLISCIAQSTAADGSENDTLFTNDTDTIYSNTYHDYGVVIITLFCIALSCIFIVAFGGNCCVVYVIIKHPSMRTRTNLLLCNLAVADILVAVLDVPVAAATLISGDFAFNSLPNKDLFCSINGFTVGLGIMLSIHTLMWISVHKFISITGVIGKSVSTFQIGLMISSAWCWSLFYNLTATPLINWSQEVYKEGASQCGPVIPNNKTTIIHAALNKIVNFVLPVTVMSVCYWKIFAVVRKHMSNMDKWADDGRRNSMIEQKRILKTLFTVMACFLACYTPYIIYSGLLVIKVFEVPKILNPLAYLAIYLNSACNPIIYALRSPSFRKGFRGCFSCLGKNAYQGRTTAGSHYEFRRKSISSVRAPQIQHERQAANPLLKYCYNGPQVGSNTAHEKSENNGFNSSPKDNIGQGDEIKSINLCTDLNKAQSHECINLEGINTTSTNRKSGLYLFDNKTQSLSSLNKPVNDNSVPCLTTSLDDNIANINFLSTHSKQPHNLPSRSYQNISEAHSSSFSYINEIKSVSEGDLELLTSDESLDTLPLKCKEPDLNKSSKVSFRSDGKPKLWQQASIEYITPVKVRNKSYKNSRRRARMIKQKLSTIKQDINQEQDTESKKQLSLVIPAMVESWRKSTLELFSKNFSN